VLTGQDFTRFQKDLLISTKRNKVLEDLLKWRNIILVIGVNRSNFIKNGNSGMNLIKPQTKMCEFLSLGFTLLKVAIIFSGTKLLPRYDECLGEFVEN